MEKEWEEEKAETTERGDKMEEKKMCKCWGGGDNKETRLKGEAAKIYKSNIRGVGGRGR